MEKLSFWDQPIDHPCFKKRNCFRLFQAINPFRLQEKSINMAPTCLIYKAKQVA
jgi:hypothetical protein